MNPRFLAILGILFPVVRLDTPSQASLHVYDNDKFIVESFGRNPMRAVVLTDKRITRLRDLRTEQLLTGSEWPRSDGF